jgi:hypothetical protein
MEPKYSRRKDNLKRILAIAIAIIAILALTVPAFADIGTSVNVTSGSDPNNAPVVKCKWEAEPNANEQYTYESGDPSHVTAGTQILPPMVKCATKPIDYYAVVSDPNGLADIDQVFAYVYHPVGSPAPYNAVVAPGGEYFKYKVEYSSFLVGTAAISAVTAAYNDGLITFYDGYTFSELHNASGTGELDKGTAALWKGTAIIDYEQPAGNYLVKVWSFDGTNYSGELDNCFYYVPECGLLLDFSSVSYGNVTIGVEQLIAGDKDPATPSRPTVENIGNTFTRISVKQNDMGFGKDGTFPATAYVGSVPPSFNGQTAPSAGETNWNVYFDARMGNDAAYEVWYDPNVTAWLPNVLGLSKKDELDFSIKVFNALPGTYTGTMWISCAVVPFDTSDFVTGTDDPCNPS